MSLLLEALKKAELAKHGSKDAAEPAGEALRIEPSVSEPTLELEAQPPSVITREELPDITQPLEMFGEDFPSGNRQRPPDREVSDQATPPPRSVVQEPAPQPPARAVETVISEPVAETPAAQSRAGDVQDTSERDAARQLFETKEVDYNPRRPFYITVGVLVLAGVSYGGYVWWQMQPHYPVVAASAISAAAKGGASAPAGAPAVPPAAPAPLETVAAGPVAAAPASPVPGAPAAAAPSRQAGQPGAPAAAAQAPVAAPSGPVFKSSAGTPASPAASDSTARPSPSARERRARAPASAPITISPPALVVDPLIERAYEAYLRGDTAVARDAYQTVLQREPGHRDALLGMAAIDVRMRVFGLAETRYLKLLEADPRDIDALAGLMSLRGQIDPIQSESRLKSLLASNPEAGYLHFVLGNQYASQNRWPEAQDAYFKAYGADPDNPDFAFNLAVSLDQLRQARPALRYYARALDLASQRPGSFDPSQARVRIQELQQR